MKSLVIAALAAALPLLSANAEIITVEYEGTVGGYFGLPDDVVLVGSFTFDSEATPAIVGDAATYPLLDHRMTLDGFPFMGDTGQSILIVANDDELSAGEFNDLYSGVSPTTGVYESVQIREFGFVLQTIFLEVPGGPLTSLALPLTEDELAAFGLKYVLFFVGENSNISVPLTRLEFLTPPLAAACDGFAAPFDAALGLGKKEQRVIPLRLALLDEDDFPLGPDDITAPTVSVGYASGIGGGELEELVESTGRATSGNSFVWDDASQQWAFNLSTRPHAAVGTYTVTAVAGDEDYVLSQTCLGTFVRQ